MTFVVIQPRERLSGGSDSVTVSWSKPSSKGRHTLRIYVGGMLATAAGLTQGARVEMAYCADTNRLRLARVPSGGRSVSMKGSTAQMATSLPHMTLAESKPAQTVPHEMLDGALILKLPDWAWLPAKRGAAQSVAQVRGRIAA